MSLEGAGKGCCFYDPDISHCDLNNVVANDHGIHCYLTLKAPITTAADNIHKYIFSLFFRENKT